jgi:hypothetical protein
VKDSDLKAAYIYNFAKFAEWPPGSFSGDAASLVIGVLGNQAVASALERVVAGHTVNGHKVDVRAWSATASIAGIHVLYIDGSQDAHLDALTPALSTIGLLVIGESERFLSWGGTIRFVVAGDRLRFEVNTASAQRAGLTLSSQLLMLAKTVRK